MLFTTNQEILSVYKGRIGRIGFLVGIVYIIAPMLIAIGLIYVLGLIFGTTSNNIVFKIIALLLYIFALVWVIWYFIEAFSLLIRRWHDLGQSGFLSLLSLVPGLNFIVLILLLVLPGKEPNQYGEMPKGLGIRSVLMPKPAAGTVPPVAPVAPVTSGGNTPPSAPPV